MDIGKNDLLGNLERLMQDKKFTWKDVTKVAIPTEEGTVEIMTPAKARKVLKEYNTPFYLYTRDHVVAVQEDFGVLSTFAIPRNPTDKELPGYIG